MGMYLLKFFKHPNYICINGSPLFIFYRIGHIGSKLAPMVKLWRSLAIEAGFPGLHLVNTIGHFGEIDTNTAMIEKQSELDAAFHFWPLITLPKIYESSIGKGDGASKNDVEHLLDTYPIQYWGSYTGFDNRPRNKNAAQPPKLVPIAFQRDIQQSFEQMATNNKRIIGKNLYFITAWNEWNEQAVLEPDDIYNLGFLEALSTALKNFPIHYL